MVESTLRGTSAFLTIKQKEKDIFTAGEVCNELELSPMFPFSSLFPASNARIPRPFDFVGHSFPEIIL